MAKKHTNPVWPKTLPLSFPLSRSWLITTIIVATVAAAVACFVIWYSTYSRTHLPPGIIINNVDLGWQSYTQAQRRLETELGTPSEHTVVLVVEDISVASSSSELGAHYSVAETLNHFRSSALEAPMAARLQWLLTQLFTETKTSVALQYDSQLLDNAIDQLNSKVGYSAIPPAATLTTSSNPDSIAISAGQMGREVDREKTRSAIFSSNVAEEIIVQATTASTGAQLDEAEIESARQRAAAYVGKQLQLTSDKKTFSLTDQDLVALLELPIGYQMPKIAEHIQAWSEAIARPAQEPILEYDPETLRVTEFVPPRDGLRLIESQATQAVLKQLDQIASDGSAQADASTTYQISLPLERTEPNRSLAETNDLGIVESIGFGESTYKGSIPNRVHNVALSTNRISNQIIPPGAEYSFNRALGPVNSSTGFRSAYVIKNGMTTLGDGGGVCQTSTTLFRTALDAGLEITRRLPHSYRVSYYEQDQKPGIDATVYTGETDFRFRNDTDHHILLYGEADSANQYMYIEVFGTSDGRTTEIVDHRTWNARPAPPPQYFPDPTLAPGQLRQIDWAAGGIQASFTNVIRDAQGNEIRRDTYTSNYRPWAAKFLRGE